MKKGSDEKPSFVPEIRGTALDVDWNRGPNGEAAGSPDGQCVPHTYLDALHRPLEQGRWSYPPWLGWKEFVPDYVGSFRHGTLCATEIHAIAVLLEMVFGQPRSVMNFKMN